MADIAFLDTGLLGAAFAKAAAQRGDAVTAWNWSSHKVQALARFGVRPAASAADAVVDTAIAAASQGLASFMGIDAVRRP